jgi:hypothetical protein
MRSTTGRTLADHRNLIKSTKAAQHDDLHLAPPTESTGRLQSRTVHAPQADLTSPARSTEAHRHAPPESPARIATFKPIRRRSYASGRQHPSAAPSVGLTPQKNNGLWTGTSLESRDSGTTDIRSPLRLNSKPWFFALRCCSRSRRAAAQCPHGSLASNATYVRDDRCVGVCYLDGMNIEEELVRIGLARDCPRFSGGRYREVEQAAADQGAAIREIYRLPGHCRARWR